MSLAEQRANLERQLAEVSAEEQRVAALTPTQRIAEVLHSKHCRWNHTDGCGWHYESWDTMSPSGARRDYLQKAEKLLTELQGEEAIILTVLNNI